MKGFAKQEAKEVLAMSQSIGLAFGGKDSKKAFEDLQIAAGYNKPCKSKTKKSESQSQKTTVSWTRQLFMDVLSDY